MPVCRAAAISRRLCRLVQPAITLCFRRKTADKKLIACLISNGPRGYSGTEGVFWRDLRSFVEEEMKAGGKFLHPVPSALHLECREEIEAKRRAEQVSVRAGGRVFVACRACVNRQSPRWRAEAER